ncbi:MAG: PTS glucose transporter subunit IIA [Mycoplasma sp.]|nr:PTS glucose transporter subunit IIA [Mycoplasma sp.]
MKIISPVAGNIIDLKELKDGVFSEKIMGDGVAIVPLLENNLEVVAPISGTLETVFYTGHAFGIKDDNGNSILIHVGIDTVNLKGEGFKVLVKQGEKIKAGDKLCFVDFKDIKDKVPSIAVIVINMLDSNSTISKTYTGSIQIGEPIFELSH